MKKTLILILLYFITSTFLYADEIDSLKTVLQTSDENKKAEILNQIADLYLYVDLDSAQLYAEKSIKIATDNKDIEHVAIAYKHLARSYNLLQNYEEAIIYIEKSEKTAIQILKNDKSVENQKVYAYILELKGRVFENKSEYPTALEIYQKVSKIFEEIDYKNGIAMVYNDMGYIHNALGNYNKSLFYFKQVYEIYLEIDNKQGIAAALNNVGIIYDIEEKRDSALYYYFESLKINEELNNIQVVAYLYHNIAIVYEFENDLDLALEYYDKSLKLTDEISDLYGSISTLSRIGVVYREKGDYKKSLKLLKKALFLSDSIKSYEIQKEVFLELSKTADLSKDYKMALDFHRKYVALKDSLFSNEMQGQIADLETKYDSEKKEQKIKLLEKDKKIKFEESRRKNILIISIISILALIIGLAILLYRSLNIKRKSNEMLTVQNARINNQKEEILAQSEELELINSELEKLSIVASETNNAIVIADNKGNIEWVNHGFTRLYGYELDEFIEKNGNNLISLSTNKEIKKIVNKCLIEKKTVIYESKTKSKEGEQIWSQTTITPIISPDGNISKLVAIDSDIRKLKKIEQEIMQKNEEILSQNEEILAQNDEIEEQNIAILYKNELINGSIRYAKTIQNAILPFQERIDNYFENFMLFRPKDVVSGDFYWYVQVENYHFVAAVDCTGHGVPGAFMSMIGNSLLNQIVYNENEYNTANILTKLNELVIFSLRQDKTDNNDGMDVCLCRIEKQEQSANVQFTGAKRPLLYIKNGENNIEILKGDRKSIGGTQKKRNKVDFSVQELILENKSIIYLSSDGYIDQNNSERKKLGTLRLITLLENIYQKDMKTQHEILNNKIENWMDGTEQRDDITLIGLKL